MKQKKSKIGPKGEASKSRMIDAAAFCLSQYGEKGTTFQKIAGQCGVSPSLVVHYFKNRKNIFRVVVEEKMRTVQERSQAAIAAASSPEGALKAYLEISLTLFREAPENAKLYLVLFYLGAFEDLERGLNTKLRNIAVVRLTGIISAGVKAKCFQVKAPEVAAKIIHNALTGTLLAQITESPIYSDRQLVNELYQFAISFLKESIQRI